MLSMLRSNKTGIERSPLYEAKRRPLVTLKNYNFFRLFIRPESYLDCYFPIDLSELISIMNLLTPTR